MTEEMKYLFELMAMLEGQQERLERELRLWDDDEDYMIDQTSEELDRTIDDIERVVWELEDLDPEWLDKYNKWRGY